MTLPASLAEWLDLLAQRHPREIDLGLERVARVAARLNLDRPAPRVVTVAGTNGKGSCVAALAALLIAGGRRVGSYTSPHLIDYNERICIDGVPVADQQICAAFARIEQNRGEISLTYFEFGTLAALMIMAAAAIDVAVLEVGLGGRLDAVNLVDADVAIITTIQLDHEAWLGDNRDAIGLEKAGIARAGMPLVCGDPEPPPAMVDCLAMLGARTCYLNACGFSFTLNHDDRDAGFDLHCRDRDGAAIDFAGLPISPLPSPSVACAVQALLTLGEPVSGAVLRQVLPRLQLAGRFQRASCRGRNLVFDVAHNPAAALLLAANLARTFPQRRIVAVFAVLADKDIAGIVAPLSELIECWHIGDLIDVPRAAKTAKVAAVLYNHSARVSRSARIEDSFFAALESSLEEDVLLVFGSFYTVSAILQCGRGEGGGSCKIV